MNNYVKDPTVNNNLNAAEKAWVTRRAKKAADAQALLQKAHAEAKKAVDAVSSGASNAAKKAWVTRRAKSTATQQVGAKKSNKRDVKIDKPIDLTISLSFATMVDMYQAAFEGAIYMPSITSAVHMIYDDEEVREDAFESLAAVITEYFGMPDNLTDGCSDWQIVEAVNNPVNPLWVGNFDELPTVVDYLRICRLAGV